MHKIVNISPFINSIPMMRNIFLGAFLVLTCNFSEMSGQVKVIDEVVAVIGDKKVLYSDVEKGLLQLKEAGEKVNDGTRCVILEQLLVQKLLLNQAEVDSIEVTESQVEGELDSRMQYFINMYGTQEKLESYWNKSIIEIKQDTRNEVREGLLTREMRRKITEGISVTPSDVRSYFKNIPPDSLPYINAEVEYNQILIYPKSSEQSIIDVREKLLQIREKVTNGESFATQAIIHSEDGSAVRGGDIGWMSRAELDPGYSKAAFALKKGAISRIIESSFGFHIIQCLDKTDDRIHTRHILIKPKISFEEKRMATAKLDSIVRLVRLDSLKFDQAAIAFSQDEDTRINGGQAVNPGRGGVRWSLDEFPPGEYAIVNKLKIGEISNPYETIDIKGKTVFKVIWLKHRTNPHLGNLKEDYNLFKTKVLQIKENERINEWVEEKIKSTYIRIIDNYKSCPYSLKGWQKS
jgi:peptidyl-prolyl cis-trans isomerase SurA